MDTHPYNPPMCYVRPTIAMEIRPSKHVDNSGKIYLPYLHEWKHVSISIEVLKLQVFLLIASVRSSLIAEALGSVAAIMFII